VLVYDGGMSALTREHSKSLGVEIDRLTYLLQGYMRFKHKTVRDVERDLGWGRGTLSRVFSGRSELKLRHILEVAATLSLTPEEFFQMAYMILPKGATLVERVVEMIDRRERRTAASPQSVQTAPQVDPESITPKMEEMARRLIAELLDPPPQDEPKDDSAAPPKRARRPRKRG
jgi:transcriptional regulator with XRE-family HTH domain